MGSAAHRQADVPGFRIGPLTTYADPAAMAEWAKRARPGDEMIYASGPALGEHAAASQARAMRDSGLVELFQRRSGRPNCFDYCAQKLAQEGDAPVPAAVGGLHHTRAQMAQLLDLLRRAAERREPCPSNAELAETLGLRRGERGRQRARYLLERLRAEHRITVTGQGRNAPRVVTITAKGRACGQSTGESNG